MYTPEEWTVIRTGLDLVTITGKNAKDLAALQLKVEKDIEKSKTKTITVRGKKVTREVEEPKSEEQILKEKQLLRYNALNMKNNRSRLTKKEQIEFDELKTLLGE